RACAPVIEYSWNGFWLQPWLVISSTRLWPASEDGFVGQRSEVRGQRSEVRKPSLARRAEKYVLISDFWPLISDLRSLKPVAVGTPKCHPTGTPRRAPAAGN